MIFTNMSSNPLYLTPTVSLVVSIFGLVWPVPLIYYTLQFKLVHPIQRVILFVMIVTYRITILHYIYHDPLNKAMIYFVCACYFVFTCKDAALLFSKQQQTSFRVFLYRYMTMRKNWLVTESNPTFHMYTTRVILILPKLVLLQYIVIPMIHSYDHVTIKSDLTMIQYAYTFGLFVYLFIDVFSEIVLLPYTYIAPYIDQYVFGKGTQITQIIRPFWPSVVAPLFSTSVFDFWSRSWHQMTSDAFKNVVYKPIRYLTGSRELALFSILLFSGIFHQIALYFTTLQWNDYSQILFFSIHGIICAVELILAQLFPQRSESIPSLYKIVYFHTVMALTSLIVFKPFAEQHWSEHLPHSVLPF